MESLKYGQSIPKCIQSRTVANFSIIEISAEEEYPRSIVISYGPMPEGSGAIMEAGGTYEELIDEVGPKTDDDPLNKYDFLGTTGYGFEVPTEDNMAYNYICVAIGS